MSKGQGPPLKATLQFYLLELYHAIPFIWATTGKWGRAVGLLALAVAAFGGWVLSPTWTALIPFAVIGILALLRSLHVRYWNLEREVVELRDKVAPKAAYFRFLQSQNDQGKTYVQITPLEFAQMFDGKPDKEIEETGKAIIGGWWAFEAVVKEVHRYKDSFHVSAVELMKCSEAEPKVFVHFDRAFEQYEASLFQGKRLEIQGQLYHISAVSIELEQCSPI